MFVFSYPDAPDTITSYWRAAILIKRTRACMPRNSLKCLATLLVLSACVTRQSPRDIDPVATEPSVLTSGPHDSLWTALGLRHQRVNALAYTPWGIYAGADHQGVFRSDSKHNRWTRTGLQDPTVSALLFVVGNRPRLLAGVRGRAHAPGTEPGVFASLDSGRTWAPSDASLRTAHVLGMASDPTHPKRVYMRSSRGVLRSEDGGRTWRYAPVGGARAVTALLVSPWGDGRVWYAAANSLEGSRVGRSEDYGATWHHSPAPFLSVLVADPAQPERLWAGSGNRVVYSNDGGRTWTTEAACLGPERTIESLLFVGPTVYFTTRGAAPDSGREEVHTIYQSRDFGETWSTIPLPPGVREVRTVVADPDRKLVIGTDIGVWRLNPSGIRSMPEDIQCGR
jgi:photosystem II stability/assembly factor-like uncharacterized protein